MIPTAAAETRRIRIPRDGAAPKTRPPLAYGATCPACGGSIRINEGDRSIRCRYCGSALYVTSPRGVQSFILTPKVTPARARLAAIRCIAERTNDRIGARNTSIIDMKLIHVPFWRMRGRLMGWIAGDRVKLARIETASEDPGAGQAYTTVREEHEAFSRLVFKRVDWSTPACVLPCLGLQGISFRTGSLDWDILDDRRRAEHTIALPTRSERNVRRDVLSSLSRLAVPAGTTVRASRFHLFDSRFSLYYFPVYVLRYGCAGRMYTITIDGESGTVVRSEVPQRKRLDSGGLFFAPALLAFLITTWFPLALIAVAAVYALDTIQARLFLPPHEWLMLRIRRLLGGED
jgi:hypothetical protein